MGSDAYLEFKWKGDQFFIFFHAAFALTHSQILPLLPLSNGQWGQTGESEVEKGKENHLKTGQHQNSYINKIYSAFALENDD